MIKVTVETDDGIGTSINKDGFTLTDAVSCCEEAIYAAGFRFSGELTFMEMDDGK